MQAQNLFCAGRAEALVLFVPARSVAATVSESCEIMGPGRRAVIARELTKVPPNSPCTSSETSTAHFWDTSLTLSAQVHEEFIRGTLGELHTRLQQQVLKVGPMAKCCTRLYTHRLHEGALFSAEGTWNVASSMLSIKVSASSRDLTAQACAG